MRPRKKQHVGPVICEQLSKVLPGIKVVGENWYHLPDNSHILIGTEQLYPSDYTSTLPPVEVDLGGDVPFVIFPESSR